MNIPSAFKALALMLAVLQLTGCEKNCTQDGEVLPILAWHSFPTNEFTLERFQELSEAGFNINFSFTSSLEDAMKSLELGEKTGVKILFNCNDLRTRPDSTAALVKDHPALWGYFLRDEPWCSDFPDLASWARNIEKADTVHPLYLNLYPNAIDCPTIGAKDYRDYVERFIDEVSLPLLSFDHYPVKNDGLHEEWYANLEIIRDEAMKHGLPFWAFAMCVPHWHYPMPQPEHLRLEMYTNLAYGAAGLQYFTYWTPSPADAFHYHDGPITNDGKRTQMYETVKALNTELQARAGVFVGSEVKDVSFTGENIPEGTKPLEGLPEGVSKLDTHGGRLLVSQLSKGKKGFLVIVSTSIDEIVPLDISFLKNAREVDASGRYIRIGKSPMTYSMTPGKELIFRIK
ncbi:MAG: beta-galactosidase [Bacteroidales bacterium]|nr:beta-galactosidase [Bacteroidales bacterium]